MQVKLPEIDTKSCCEIGTYKHQIPMPINGRIQDIDYCISPIVAALNAANIKTLGSCCGHGKLEPSIIFELNGKELEMNIKDFGGKKCLK